MRYCGGKYKKQINANLKKDLDDNFKKIKSAIEELKTEGSFYDYHGAFSEYDAISKLTEIYRLLDKKYKIIFNDYNNLLNDDSLKLLVKHIDDIEALASKELYNVIPISGGVWQDEMGIAHEDTEEDLLQEYEERLENLLHGLFLRKLRTKNAYYRRQKKVRSHNWETWVPIAISAFSMIISIISMVVSIIGLCVKSTGGN